MKLDTGILDSTLWVDADACKLFIAALCVARLHEITEPEQTYQTFSNDPDEFIVPVGWYGLVQAAGPGLVRRAALDLGDGMSALHRLSQPDQLSRSVAHDGRRLVRVNRGFVVLNYVSYRDIDYSAAERQARFREREKKRKATTSNGSATDSNGVIITTITHASSNSNSNSITPEEKNKNKKAPDGALLLPEWLDPETWRNFEQHRKAIRKPLKGRARELVIAKLNAARAKGHDPASMIDTAIERGWQTVFEPQATTALRVVGDSPQAPAREYPQW